jgi:hypothetical protein
MDPPDGYVTVTCPTCERRYQTLRAAPAAFCSIACADVTRLVAAMAPSQGHLSRAVRCSYCREPMRVALRLRPPYRCPRCAGWRR